MSLFRRIIFLTLAAICATASSHAQTTVGESATFAFDTRAFDGLSGLGVSGTFVLDTRVGLSITGVTPNPVPGSGANQPFTINGSGFDSSCSLTLRNMTSGSVYPNRSKLSQSTTSIALNPNFGNNSASWTVEVINPGGVSSGQFPFTVTASQTLSSLAIVGPSTLAAGQTATLQAIATFSGGTQSDVSAQTQWGPSGGSSATHMSGATLIAGSGPASTATITATYTAINNSGTRTATKSVAIAEGNSVDIDSVSKQYLSSSGNNVSYQLTTRGLVIGPALIVSEWRLDNNNLNVSGNNLNTTVAVTPGTHRLTFSGINALNQTCSRSVDIFFEKAPRLNELFPHVGSGNLHVGRRFDAGGVNYYNETAQANVDRRPNGLVIIIHGMNNYVATADWMKGIAEEINKKLPANKPNVILYDWQQDADVTLTPVSDKIAAVNDFPNLVSLTGRLASLVKAAGQDVPLNLAGKLGVATEMTINLLSLRQKGTEHGQALAEYLEAEIAADRVLFDAPIYLIGHSAGGFVATSCAAYLFKSQILPGLGRKPINLQVTTLDTPILTADLIRGIRTNGGRFDRYVSSIIGDAQTQDISTYNAEDLGYFLGVPRESLLVGPIFAFHPKSLRVTSAVGFDESLSYHVGKDTTATGINPIARHVHAHQWFIETVVDPNRDKEGWYYSPFLGNTFPGGSGAAMVASSSIAAFGGVAASPPPPMSGFSTFGSVVEPTTGSYTLTEQGNAGIYQTVTLPMNVSTLKFRVQFTQPGDGDYIEVSFGDHLSLAVIADGSIVRAGLVEFEVPVVHYGGETGQLLIKLNGLGADNAVAVVDSITINTADDADGDGLTFAQETALGTDPRYHDSDADGLDDLYETSVSMTNPLQTDSDGDGMSDAAELTAGTNPSLPTSRFIAYTPVRNANGSVALTWNAVAGKSYTIYRSASADFANNEVVASALLGTAPQTSWMDSTVPAGAAAMFYVVQVEEE